ncbi:hypothetical protein ASPZODRAFT_153779 [Penicilliopsis zonata CBS 506.65]|uniref:Uncharacterized protein n=1 Tax=Penicilliopsis zonata CBS 506.65 TaxID=1073090 RepID=A0A1L9SAV6_9EURO|nr:hypothetical protein ASPZODRAFT_153779 [Penicilliopsis zonata CBS 506.65]OJJ44315.1 hypothetical protein ASPZODRAFT_153779 [Penicilliopsis zonata CBS 506.65]
MRTKAGKKPGKGPAASTADRKRRASSSLSSVSSVSGFDDLSDASEDDSEEEEEEEDADDEEDRPALLAPSYAPRRDQGRKTGLKSTPNRKKMRRLSDDEGYDGQNSNQGSDADDSSDDAYAAVDDISDGDDEEQEVEILEELLIVESEDEHQIGGGMLSATGDVTGTEVWAAPAGSFNDHILLPGASFFDEEHLYSAMETFGETDLTSEAALETPMPRRVHFEEHVSDSSSDSDSHTDDEIPSDFLQQDSLDPQLRRMIENDTEPRSRSNRRHSEEIFGDADYGHANIYHVESDAVSEESSGYETDDGETTDEDLPPPATITHPRSILRRDSSASLAPVAEETKAAPPRRRGPIMGTFVADPHKPVALVDGSGKHLVIIPAYASSRHDWLESAANSICNTANNSPRATTMHLIDESDTDAFTSPNHRHAHHHHHADLSPMLTSSANLMMTALGNEISTGGQVMGPPEAFYPSRDFTLDSSFEDDDEDDPEAALNVEDFIDFGNGSSDDGEDDDDDDDEDEEDDLVKFKAFDDDNTLASPMGAPRIPEAGTPTPNRSGSGGDAHQASSAERFLNHLDRGIVTAFRRNHNRYQALLRLPQHREFMPANSPSRPASVFRHSRHTDPKTPTRKRKASGLAGGEAVRRKLMDAQRRSQLPF